MQSGQEHDYHGADRRREARTLWMLQCLYRQLHEPWDQQRKGISENKKYRSADISAAERYQIWNKSGKIFNRDVLKAFKVNCAEFPLLFRGLFHSPHWDKIRTGKRIIMMHVFVIVIRKYGGNILGEDKFFIGRNDKNLNR